LGQSYPNPTRGIASFEYELGKAGKVRVRVYNVAGQAVKTLVEGLEPAGRHVVIWDGRDEAGRMAGSGTYFYCLEAGDRKAVRKLVIIK
jgi:flagellar hook assembly protein FlgD